MVHGNGYIVLVERHFSELPARRPAHRAPEAPQGAPLHGHQATPVVGVHARIGHPGGAHRLAEKRCAEGDVPYRQHLSEVAVMQVRAQWVHPHVMQPVEARIDHDSFQPASETPAHVGVGKVLHQFAQQREQGEFGRVHAHRQAHAGQDQRLQHAVQVAAAVIGPAAHLALAVVHAVQRPPPGQQVLGAMHPVVDEVVDQVVGGKKPIRVLLEPRHPVLESEGGRLAFAAAAEQVGERREHQDGEQRKQAQQHEQGVEAVDAGQAPLAPAFGRRQRFQWPEDQADDGDLDQCDQPGLGDLAGVTCNVPDVQREQHGRHHVDAEPGDQLGPGFGHGLPRFRNAVDAKSRASGPTTEAIPRWRFYGSARPHVAGVDPAGGYASLHARPHQKDVAMYRPLVAAIATALALIAASCTASLAADTAGYSLTVYSAAQPGQLSTANLANYGANLPGYALVRDGRRMSLPKGSGELRFSDVAKSIDTTTVAFESLSDTTGTRVIEQNYQYDLVDNAKLLDRYIGQTITVDQVRGDKTEQVQGKLLSASGGMILQKDSGEVVSLANYSNIQFPALPGGLITKPTLVWKVSSDRGGEQDTRVSYQTQGVTWWSDYNIILRDADGGCRMDLAAWVTIVNQSGGSYPNAQLKLVAGEVN